MDVLKGDGSTMLKCGIYDQEGNPWALSAGMSATQAQVKRLASHYEDSSDFYINGPVGIGKILIGAKNKVSVTDVL